MIAGLLALVVVAASLLASLYPLLSAEPAAREIEDLPELQARRSDLLRALKDVEMDHAMGKITDEDRDRLQAELEGRAVRVLAAIEEREKDGAEPGA